MTADLPRDLEALLLPATDPLPIPLADAAIDNPRTQLENVLS
jgi:hypothetical protein